MPDPRRDDPEAVSISLLLAAGFLMEEASTEFALPASPTREVLIERVALLDGTVTQLSALARGARAALRQAAR